MWLSKYRFQAAICLFMALTAWTLGYGVARLVYQNQISSLKNQYAQETAQRERETAQQFQAALNEQQKWQ